jgi:opacity protein-like surface antigen
MWQILQLPKKGRVIRRKEMKKKTVLTLLMATLLTSGLFAQISMSAGAGGSFSMHMTDYTRPAYVDPKPIVGGGFNAFFDATYAMVKVGMFIGGDSREIDWGTGNKVTMKMTYNYFSLGLLGKYPIDLGGFTMFPMLGFEYNMLLSGEMEAGGATETFERSPDNDMYILQLGVGADFNLTDKIYLRPNLLWGIDFRSSERDAPFKANNGAVFKHKLDIGIAAGFKF